MARLSIRVLGPFQTSLGGEAVSGFASDKVRALLAYLALSPGRPRRRETLAGLLWPDFPERSARTNLRNALANLRQVIRDRDASPPFLQITHQTIQFNDESDYWLDADAFEALTATTPPVREELEQAVSLVRGTFLEGFCLADAAPFEEWMLLCREHFGRQLLEALGTLAAIYEERGDYEQALAHARRRVELEPWDEDGQRQLMRLLALRGRRHEALAQYEDLHRSLQENLGVEPLPETKALWEEIVSGEWAQGQPTPIWHLPAPQTPFFGRVDEIAILQSMLSERDTRLVTLLGLGGSGKTRLALELGRRLAERDRQALVEQAPLTFSHGIVFVPLEGIETVDGLVAALARALRLRLEGGQEQLLEFLRRKQFLLILDSMEHLLAGVLFLADILQVAPGVKILATSRERLHLLGERTVPLGGLPYPQHDLVPPVPGTPDWEAWLVTYPALQLLEEGVRRVRGDYSPTDEDLRAGAELCRLVDGLPLALELATSWADIFSLKDILLEGQRGLDFLRADWSNSHERQRSIRAVFDASWQRLTLPEQTTFSSLSIFRGGFTREAARHVVVEGEAIPRLLAALVRKSFLQYDQEGRYRIHALLRQYGAEKLAEETSRAAQVGDRHSAYYLGALQRREADLLGSQQQAALLALESESKNIRAGWTWAAERTQIERLDQALEAAFCFYWYSGRYQEGAAAFRAAAAAATAAGSTADETADKVTCLRVRLRASAWESQFESALGQPEVARRIQQEALSILEAPALVGWDTRLERAVLALTNGFTLASADFERARQQFKESHALFRDLGLQWGMARALTSWGNLSAILGNHADARARLEEGLAIWRALGNHSDISWSLGFLAYLARTEGRFEDSAVLAQQAYAVSLEEGTRGPTGMTHLFLADALEHLGRFSEAHAVLEEGLALAGDRGNLRQYTQVHSGLVRVSLHLGRYEEARNQAEAGLELTRAHGPRFCVGLNLVLLGCLDLAEGDFVSALRHLQHGIAVNRDCGQTDDVSWNHALLALAARGHGDIPEARRHLLEACQIAVDLGVVPPLLWALPVAALLLADGGQCERAVEIYALASRYPLVANSRWFEDVAGSHLAAIADTLPAAVGAEAKERGQARDLPAAAEGLLIELRT